MLNSSAKTKLAMLAFLYYRETVKNSNKVSYVNSVKILLADSVYCLQISVL